ncbi:low affinity iron permease family protein [Criblamydia sequanensis]|uniref:Conserved putative membrane protein n=1 Tax=Candidatus Criblamydia sequanensis CRIB-18 TaxID=1437425 RepID=A0A090D319_9BACT|nr:low affinity iron permease family protein [Criblamydia sequanensis]CDR34843.1 Conserved putative membrane protein [Criblamydia sequanensis CRIB-18]
MKQLPSLSRFLTWSAKMAGNPITFVIALSVVAIWLIIGFFYGFNAKWILILNTVATLNAALMVFIIQNTQNRENKALHLKIDELIRVTKEATDEFIAIEELEEAELEKIRKKIFKNKS